MLPTASIPGTTCFLARVDGQEAGGGTVALHEGVATLSGTGVREAFRGRGPSSAGPRRARRCAIAPRVSLAPTLYDFQIALSHVDRALDHPQLGLKVARHPSETMQRVWLRVLAFCWLWEERMAFGKGLGEPEAPDLECRDYTGLVTSWVRVGKADPVKLQRAVDQHPHAKVSVLFESPERLESFLAEAREVKATRVARAQLAAVDAELLQALSAFDSRRIKLSLTFVGDHAYAECEGQSFDGPLTRASP